MWIEAMPTLQIINSIKIDVYAREHMPPHFHAIYAEHEMVFEIDTLATYAGWLPPKQYRLIIRWAQMPGIRSFLLDNFNRLNPNLRK
jgi:Domain of unknown function (DUF4160)